MLRVLRERLRQKHRTLSYPRTMPRLPARFRGAPAISGPADDAAWAAAASACPTRAIDDTQRRLDLGRCLFCGACERVTQAIRFGADSRLAVRSRDALWRDAASGPLPLAQPLDGVLARLYGRSLRLRQVSAGGCNACEAEVNVLGTVVFDMARFGIEVVASPRHADGLLITGPVSRNMALALRKTYDAVPPPRLVIAVGACAISGGPFVDLPQVQNGASSCVPVDLFVPGCPPHPLTILDGLLRLLGYSPPAPPEPSPPLP